MACYGSNWIRPAKLFLLGLTSVLGLEPAKGSNIHVLAILGHGFHVLIFTDRLWGSCIIICSRATVYHPHWDFTKLSQVFLDDGDSCCWIETLKEQLEKSRKEPDPKPRMYRRKHWKLGNTIRKQSSLLPNNRKNMKEHRANTIWRFP